jgi:hypothetical protein
MHSTQAFVSTFLEQSAELPFKCFPQFCSTRAELVIVHTMAFRRTVIRAKLSAWTCQPFCCQRAFTLIPSGPQHSAEIFQIAPENKKPGVERRAKPPYEWLCAKLDNFLACARKEPHYRIYFWPSLDLTLGRTFFDPTVTPLQKARSTSEPFVSIRGSGKTSSPLPNKIKGFCVNPGALCKSGILAGSWGLLDWMPRESERYRLSF